MKSKFIVCLAILGMIASLVAGCSPTASATSAAATSAAPTTAAPATVAPTSAAVETSAPATTPSAAAVPNAVIPKFEDIQFPDSLPAEIPMADDSLYAYDDLTTKYDMEILTENYGTATWTADKDPICMWLNKKFNVNITFTTVPGADKETTINTRFAASDYPDILTLASRDQAFTFSDQSLLVDAKKIYPYMPQTQKFVTKNMIKWSTNKSNGEIPFITKYAIQDGVWSFGIRKDWLTKFGMDIPKTEDQLLAFAKACVQKDPDGNGKADTYFMAGAGGGKNFGMLGGFQTAYGNPAAHVENGQLAHPYFDGVEKKYLQLLNKFYAAKLFTPDWYTIDWETNKPNTFNGKVGMVWYPVSTLMGEVSQALSDQKNNTAGYANWESVTTYPIEGGKYNAAGNPGYLTAFSASKFTDEGKLKRAAHMIDTMVMGGSSFTQTIQGSTSETFKAANMPIDQDRDIKYTDDHKAFYITATNATAKPWADTNTIMALAPWQVFGLAVNYQITDPNASDPWLAAYAKATNEAATAVNGFDRWPNDGLLVTLTGDAATANASNIDWINAQEYAFVTGTQSFDDWDKFTTDWLSNHGGKEIIKQSADSLGVPVPDYAK